MESLYKAILVLQRIDLGIGSLDLYEQIVGKSAELHKGSGTPALLGVVCSQCGICIVKKLTLSCLYLHTLVFCKAQMQILPLSTVTVSKPVFAYLNQLQKLACCTK